eukprot:s2068_g3.t4
MGPTKSFVSFCRAFWRNPLYPTTKPFSSWQKLAHFIALLTFCFVLLLITFKGRVRQSHQSLEEFDSTPLRPFWLDQFYAEVFHYPRTAIRGSRYRGDSWDNFLHHIPNSLLYHMNGNAIYFLRHPWLSFLAQKLEEDATSENGSVAFDVRMAQLTLEAPTRSDLQTAWTQNVPEGENPYQDDSLLVGNYANTLLNDSFEPPEFVRHGALANIFENLDESLVTLAVQAFHQANATLLMESLRESAFREVVVVSSVDFAPTPGTAPSLRVVPATLPEHMALCDLAAAVHTTFFLFTDTYHFIPGPTHVLVNGSRPVLPYIPASSVFCTAYPECTTSLDQAENFYGVKLNYHHNKYETLFHTLLAREFCQSWNLAAAAMGSFHSCDYQHGPTADDYIAWLISMDKAFDYMPKNKERVGWRQWSVLWNAHPADQRACSIYTESDALKRKQSIKECSLYIQDGDACNADENCTFRAIFEAGKCMSTSEFRLLPAMMDARTSTWTISTSSTTTSRTSTLSSSTRSRTLTSSWTTLTATSSTSTTRSTVSGTFSTVFASSTRTQSAQPTISLPTFCKEVLRGSWRSSDGLPIVGVDVSNCIGRVAGESCSVICTGSFEGDPATFVCGNDGTFTGEIHCQESTCAVETLPDGFETDCEQTPPGGSCFVRCPEGYQPAQAMYICTTNAEFLGVPPTCELQLCGLVGLPETAGVDTLACVEGVRSGQSCEVGCSYGFEGDSSTYRCVQGVFEGSPPACQRKACEAPREEVSFSSSCGAELLHGQSCLSSCKPGFMGAATQLQCENGILTGLPPVCIGSLCSLEGIVIGTGLDTSDCLGKRTSESCTLKCQRGYTPVGQPNLTCQSNGRFHSEEFRCLPKPCGDLSAVPSFASSAVGNSCSGLAFGQVCAAFCEIGWQIQGNASVIVCDDSGDASQGFAQYFSENRSYLPAERTQPMFRCIALECTEGLPSMKGVSHDCEGKTTHETCQVNAQLGYFADRPSTLTCQADGGFQGDWPVILPQTCPNFSFSPGVGSTCRNATLGTECWAYCESGWIGSPRRYECKLNATGQLQLEALEGITCTISGNRNGRRLAQSCADANADVRLLNPSFLHSCASLQDGDVCVVHCSSGFAMLEAEPALLSCQDGQFVGGLLPSCSPRSCDFAFPTGTGVQHDCNGRKTGENCTAQCGEEFTYTFGGAETFTCTSSGNFLDEFSEDARNKPIMRTEVFFALGTNPSCERKFCEDLQIPELYTHNCREKRSGDTCGVTCALGYYFASWGSQFLCNGTFQGTLPSCQPNPCTDVPALGEVFSGSCEGLTTGESCELSCGASRLKCC